MGHGNPCGGGEPVGRREVQVAYTGREFPDRLRVDAVCPGPMHVNSEPPAAAIADRIASAIVSGESLFSPGFQATARPTARKSLSAVARVHPAISAGEARRTASPSTSASFAIAWMAPAALGDRRTQCVAVRGREGNTARNVGIGCHTSPLN